MATALPRPRQVTIAGWMIMAGSVAVVLTVFQQIAGLQSIDTRDAVQSVLSEPPFDGLGMSVDQVLGLIRVLSMVAAACATATAILGWQALQRSKSARIALSVLAVPLLITGVGTGGVLSTAVAAAVLLLWLQPARDWFDGRWRPAPAEQRRPPADRPAAREQAPPAEPQRQHPSQHTSGGSQPPPYVGWPPPPPSGGDQPPVGPPSPTVGPPPHAAWPPPQGSPSQPPAGWAQHGPLPSAQRPPGAVSGRVPTSRPPAVLAAVIVTWVCSVLMGGLFILGAAWLIASPDTLMEEMTRQDPELVRDGTLTVGLLRATLGVMIGVVVVWVVAACVLAFFVLRRASWARVLLLVSCGMAGLALVICSVVNPLMVVPLAGAGAAFALLVRRDVTAWFRGR